MVAAFVRAGALLSLGAACHPVALTVPPARVAAEHVRTQPTVGAPIVAIPTPRGSVDDLDALDTLDEHVTRSRSTDSGDRGGASYTVRRGGEDVWIRGDDRILQHMGELYDVGPYAPSACPLLVAFDDASVEMSPAPASAASFELGRAASCDAADWPSPDTPWLVWDHDQSGAIEGGHELLGTATRVAPGRWADDGFAALATADADGNGRIDADDPAYAALRLWADHDNDRRSSPDELTTLSDAGIASLPLSYIVDERCDARGNCLRERADITMRADAPHGSATLIDVHARCQ